MRRRAFLGGIALSAAGCAQADLPPAPAAAPPHAAVPQLGKFFAALHELQAGTRKTPVSVLQIGDSHTANDGFSGRLRELFQARFGDAGRGLLPPGIPFRFYKPDHVHVSETGWRVASSFAAGASGPFGITGLRQRADGPAEMVFSVERPGDLAETELEFLAGAQSGTFDVVFDIGPTESSAQGDQARVWQSFYAPAATRMTLRTQGGVDLLSCRLRRTEPGITWSNLGTIGATVALLKRWDPALVRAELAHENPDLIVLAFGSNEGFQDSTNLARYAERYRDAIAMLQGGAPNASILLVGAPDGVRRPIADGGTLCPGGAWQTPPKLNKVRDVQRAIAHESDLFWWDWSHAMGGQCSMVDWAAQTPPLASPDHLHLLHAGYRKTAEALFADIIARFDTHVAG